MRHLRVLAVLVAGVTASTLLAGLGILPAGAATPRTTVLKYLLVPETMSYNSAAGLPVPESVAPQAGYHYFEDDDLYAGDYARHSKSVSATASLYCTIESVSMSDVPAQCEGVLAVGSSMIVVASTMNFAANSNVTRLPVVGGTGRYDGATGAVVVTNVGSAGDGNFVLRVTTP